MKNLKFDEGMQPAYRRQGMLDVWVDVCDLVDA
jgi:hypothetical protein